jgi:osmotically inducible protein OsmC
MASKHLTGRQRHMMRVASFGTTGEITMDRSASAVWHGGLKDGKGTISVQSGVLHETPYSFTTRFENEPGTNPEELIAAAHAGCFTMALSGQLSSTEHTPELLETTATVTMEKTDDGPTITKIHLVTRAKIANIEKEKFDELAKKAKEGCPISRLLKAAEITLDAQLV